MIREDVLTWLNRWRETFIGIAVLALGLYWSFTAFGILLYIGVLLVLAGGAIIWEGIRRARFPADGGGAGVVEVDERQITYLTAEGGRAVSIDGLVKVEVETTAMGPFAPDLFWVFYSEDAAPLRIPGNAEGAAALFDALAALPGVNYEAAMSAAGSTEPAIFAVWRKEPKRLH